MNVFYLDHDPVMAARYHCDSHVIKMVIESTQLLLTTVTLVSGIDTPYKPTHVNHPCAVWARSSYENWAWLLKLAVALEKEWQFRWRHTKQHGSLVKMREFFSSEPAMGFSRSQFQCVEMTTPALAMPDDVKCGDPVEAYRAYYRVYKTHLHSWRLRGRPEWL